MAVSRSGGHASPGQHLRDVQHARRGIAGAAQTPFDIEHAAEVAEHDGVPARSSRIFAHFSSTIAVEMSPYFTANVPPKPQQCSQPFISVTATPDLREQRARLRLHAEFAQARAGIVIRHLPRRTRPAAIAPWRHSRGNRSVRRRLARSRAEAVHQFGIVGERGRRNARGSCRRTNPTAPPRNRTVRTRAGFFRRDRARCGRSPELYAGCPQHVCAGGTTTSKPAPLDQLDDRKTDLGAHQVDETGDEQSDSHEPSFGKTSLIIRCLAHSTNGQKA